MEYDVYETIRRLPRRDLETLLFRATIRMCQRGNGADPGSVFQALFAGFLLGAAVAAAGFLLGMRLG